MRARLRQLGGTLTVESAPGEGTVVSAAVPLTPVVPLPPGTPGTPGTAGAPDTPDAPDAPDRRQGPGAVR